MTGRSRQIKFVIVLTAPRSRARVRSAGGRSDKGERGPKRRPSTLRIFISCRAPTIAKYCSLMSAGSPTSNRARRPNSPNIAPKAAGAVPRLEKVLALEKDPKSLNSNRAHTMLLSLRIANIDQASAAEQRKMIDELKQALIVDPNGDNSQLAMELATNLEFGNQIEAAAEAYEAFAKALAKSDPDSQLGKRMEGAARRLSIVGKPIELNAISVDGQPFDWSKYRGKVVLVDFWATWCRPCREELPNIRANYAKYYPRGFEVVGVSQDDDMPALKEFLTQEKFPWVTLLDRPDKPHQPSPSEHFGIFGIPCTFLVDREGKVVTMKARAPIWGDILKNC